MPARSTRPPSSGNAGSRLKTVMMPLATAISMVISHSTVYGASRVVAAANTPVSSADTTGPAPATSASSRAVRGMRSISETPPSRNSWTRTTPTPKRCAITQWPSSCSSTLRPEQRRQQDRDQVRPDRRQRRRQAADDRSGHHRDHRHGHEPGRGDSDRHAEQPTDRNAPRPAGVGRPRSAHAPSVTADDTPAARGSRAGPVDRLRDGSEAAGPDVGGEDRLRPQRDECVHHRVGVLPGHHRADRGPVGVGQRGHRG